jgi:hypothetical protein
MAESHCTLPIYIFGNTRRRRRAREHLNIRSFSITVPHRIHLSHFRPQKQYSRGLVSSSGYVPSQLVEKTSVKYLCQVAKDVAASHGKLVSLFERIHFFLQHLSIYIGVPLTAAISELLGKIMGQVLSILALSTKEMTQRRISECDWLDVSLLVNYGTERFLNRLVGRTDIQDAFDRLDMLTKEETGMTTARNLAVTHVVDGHVKVVEEVARGIDEVTNVIGHDVRAIKDGPQSPLH